MDREKFISILTDGYEFHNHLLEEVPIITYDVDPTY